MGDAKYRVAIVGAGRIGGLLEGERPPSAFRKPHSHFASYNAVDETEVVAVAGRSEGRLKMFTELYGITNLVHRLPRDDRGGAARHRQRDDADDPQGRGHHVRGGARRSRHLRRKGPVHFPGRGRPDSGCRQRERRGLQLRRGATAPRRVPTAARGDSAGRHRRAEVRFLLLAHRPDEAPLAHDRHAGVPIGRPPARLGGREARAPRRPAGRRQSKGSPRGHGHAPASAAPADAEHLRRTGSCRRTAWTSPTRCSTSRGWATTTAPRRSSFP